MDDINGWRSSANAWIDNMRTGGDFTRIHVLDKPMLARIHGRGFQHALDVGCGEGRFCRMMQKEGIQTTGLDPVEALIEAARKQDEQGDYHLGKAEKLPFKDASFDLVVSYLTLIDIDDIHAAITEMARVLQPGGVLLVANLTSFSTAAVNDGWVEDEAGQRYFMIDHYLEEIPRQVEFKGVNVRNWHRPLSAYMRQFLEAGLILRVFDEPDCTATGMGADAATGMGADATIERYRRVPWAMMMEWQKPAIR